eukprot:2673803-Amphidinium_carterae.1
MKDIVRYSDRVICELVSGGPNKRQECQPQTLQATNSHPPVVSCIAYCGTLPSKDSCKEFCDDYQIALEGVSRIDSRSLSRVGRGSFFFAYRLSIAECCIRLLRTYEKPNVTMR